MVTALPACASTHSAPRSLNVVPAAARDDVYRLALQHYLGQPRGCALDSTMYVSLNGRSPSAAFLESAQGTITLEPLKAWDQRRPQMLVLDVDIRAVTGPTVVVEVSQNAHQRIARIHTRCTCTSTLERESAGGWAVTSAECSILE